VVVPIRIARSVAGVGLADPRVACAPASGACEWATVRGTARAASDATSATVRVHNAQAARMARGYVRGCTSRGVVGCISCHEHWMGRLR
jgi:hypothetical protein